MEAHTHIERAYLNIQRMGFAYFCCSCQMMPNERDDNYLFASTTFGIEWNFRLLLFVRCLRLFVCKENKYSKWKWKWKCYSVIYSVALRIGVKISRSLAYRHSTIWIKYLNVWLRLMRYLAKWIDCHINTATKGLLNLVFGRHS